DGRGLSTQVADLAAFFLTAGACILVGLTTGDRLWFYPTILMLGLAAVGRVLAWLVHGAALTLDMIAVEAIVSTVLVFVARAPTSRDRA
ncbi:MAG: hypothetical protein ACFCGT_26750, partial [Sandaracinaceae bacterium]